MTPSAGTTKAYSPRYRPDIDGLRALAVLSVMLFHAGLGCRGGYVGVDVFFVISGFLISSLILEELGGGVFSIFTFWERRIRRILPALAVVVLATLVAGWFLYLPHDFRQVGKSAIGQAMLIVNFFFARNTDYFAAGLDTRPLLHTWSLAVEEQFYLLFPPLLMILAQHKRLSLSYTIVGLAVGSFLLSVAGSYLLPLESFYLLPMRGWELLMGAWLAATRESRSAGGRVRETAGWLGVGLVCYSVFFYDRDTRFPGLAAIPPCLGTALIIFSSEPKLSFVGRLLAFKPVVFIGLISYSLYLWHWPLLIFAKYQAREAPSAGFRAALLALSAGLAILSWKYVEIPIRKRWILRRRPQAFGFAGVSMAALLGLGLLICYHDGFPSRFPANALYYADFWNHRTPLTVTSLQQAMAGEFVEFGSQDTNQPVRVLIWGDSHAMALTPVLDELCRECSQRGVQATQISTAPVLGYVSTGPYSLKQDSPAFARAVLRFIAQQHVRNVIIAARWSGYPGSDSLRTNLLSTVRQIMDSGARVFVVEDVPAPDFDVPRIAALTAAHHGDLEQLSVTREEYQKSYREFRPMFEQLSRMGATVLDPAKYFLNRNGNYDVVKDDQVLYWDSHHLTVEGSMMLAPMFRPIFQTE